MLERIGIMKSVLFKTVPLGGWFKPAAADCWHLKTSVATGMYQHCGTPYEPRFGASESVLVE